MPDCSSSGLGFIAVVGAQVGVEVVSAGTTVTGLGARNQGQVGRIGTKPVLGLPWVYRRLHRFTHLVGGKEQVVLDLLFRQSDVLEAVVSHEGRRMAVQAVIDKQLGAVLQRGQIVGCFGRPVQRYGVTASSMAACHHGQGHHQAPCDFLELFHVVLSAGLSAAGRSPARARVWALPVGSTMASGGKSRNKTAYPPATPAHRSVTAAGHPGTPGSGS